MSRSKKIAIYLVQVIIASTLSGPSLVTSSLIAFRSVTNSSPLFDSSTTTGSSPAVRMDLKQDFWSIRDHITYLFFHTVIIKISTMTYFASGLVCLKLSRQRERARPVATGTKKQPLVLSMPDLVTKQMI